MAPKKKATPTGDDKSPQLAAATVGAGTELVQAPPQPKKDGEVLVDPDAEAARLEAEQQAAEEARLAAEAQAAEAARLEAEQQAAEEARLAAEAQAAEAARLEAEQQAAEEARLAAEAQAAEAARLEAEQQAAEEARLAAEAQAAEAARLEAEQQAVEEQQALANKMVDAGIATFNKEQPDWLLGQFDVKAKSPAGFWRCGIQFLHSSATRVFVVTAKADVPHDHSCEIPCCYLTQEEAKRVYGEQWLTVLIDSEVIKD
ncbi:hypothetical protein [Aeromonas sp. SCS5]|uniref:hypothetical protein n=1 Tax=Aeromonas sp. SCS5 TaxID=1519205 RepID=UPI000AEEE687|nr:hypothetical protein [Aeromonas sp. SCS5]